MNENGYADGPELVMVKDVMRYSTRMDEQWIPLGNHVVKPITNQYKSFPYP